MLKICEILSKFKVPFWICLNRGTRYDILKFMRYISRAIEKNLQEALSQFPACLITGPRQAGKSTLLQNVLKDYTYITLDDPVHRSMADQDPELFLSSFPAPLIIDEIQYVPKLLSYIKIRIDQKRRIPGQYVLTGSQVFQLMKGVSESLAGRIAIFQLYPLSWTEIIDQFPVNDTVCAKQTIQGFYPEFLVSPKINWNLWYGSYLATYIERDVRNIKSITDLGRFQSFISLLATRAGQLLNLSEIAGQCGISQPTAKDWLSILEATYIIQILRPYHNNLSKRLVKTPKILFVDTGLLCYLLGIDNEERFFKAAERGHVFENMVIMEAVKRLSHKMQRSQVFFYRTSAGVEVDLIIDSMGKLNAYEIKLSKTPNKEMTASLSQFIKDHKVGLASLLTLYDKKILLTDNIETQHWSKLLLEE